MGPSDLTEILPALHSRVNDPSLLVGIGDDAGVYRLSDELAIVQTTDFITPIVDDPFSFGAIAAANALSDLFTMGAEAKTALALVMHDAEHISFEALRKIVEGGLSKIEECGATLLGGHTISDVEMKYGLSVTGVVHPQRFWRNKGAQIGDKLILTKPLGMGILTTAAKADMAQAPQMSEAIAFMSRLNLYAMRSALNFEVHACTDITGFGLLGHMLEMLDDSIGFTIEFAKVPYLASALDFAKAEIVPGGTYRNRDWAMPSVRIAGSIDHSQSLILFDAQTSGGLLIAIKSNHAEQCLDRIRSNGDEKAEIIGEVSPRGKWAIEAR
jgi:selenide,water dikinase